MSRFIPVDPEKWAAMVIAQSDLVRYKKICDELDAECTRLKAEVERLTAVFVPENLILRADVNRLKNNCDYLDRKLDEELDKSAMLCGQVERLHRHGDLMLKFAAANMTFPAYATMAKDWNAAKEGNQP